MNRLRAWISVSVPETLSAWLLPSYRRPLVFLVGLGVLPLALILGAAHQLNASLWRSQALHNLQVAARLAAEIIDETVLETQRFEQVVAAQPELLDHLRQRNRPALERDLGRLLPFIARADAGMVLDLEGRLLAAHPSRPERPGAQAGGDEPFAGTRDAGWAPYVSGVYLREGPEIEKVVSVMIPIRRGEELLGLLQVQHRVEEIKSWLQKIRIEPAGFLYVVDQHQQLIVHPMQVLPGRPRVVADWPPVAQPLAGQGATLAFRQKNGEPWLAGIAAVGELGWRVVAVQPEEAALGAFRRVFWTLAGLIGALMLIVVALCMGWVRLHLLSLRLLRQNAKLIRQLQQRLLRKDRPS